MWGRREVYLKSTVNWEYFKLSIPIKLINLDVSVHYFLLFPHSTLPIVKNVICQELFILKHLHPIFLFQMGNPLWLTSNVKIMKYKTKQTNSETSQSKLTTEQKNSHTQLSFGIKGRINN